MQSPRSMPRSHRAKSLAHNKSCRPRQRRCKAEPSKTSSRRSCQPIDRWSASEAGPLFSQSSYKISPVARISAAKARGDVYLLRDYRNQNVDILCRPGYDAQQTERSPSNDDPVEPESPAAKKQVERLDSFYRPHGISITDTNLTASTIWRKGIGSGSSISIWFPT